MSEWLYVYWTRSCSCDVLWSIYCVFEIVIPHSFTLFHVDIRFWRGKDWKKENKSTSNMVSFCTSSTNELHVFVASKREIVVVFYWILFCNKTYKDFFVLVQYLPITFYFFQERSFTKQSKLIHHTIKIFFVQRRLHSG